MNFPTAIIIDDSPHSNSMLRMELEKYCPQLNLVGQFHSSENGLTGIEDLNPNIVFLDIDMPVMNGFELLEKVKRPKLFEVIFTTGYDSFAIKAFKVKAIDYLLKPIDPLELIDAVQTAIFRLYKSQSKYQLQLMIQAMGGNLFNEKKNDEPNPVVALPTVNGLDFIRVEDIVYCASDNNYTIVYLADKVKKIVSKPLKWVENIFNHYSFFRVHKSYLINLAYIKQYQKGDGGKVIMIDNTSLNVARNRKEAFLNLFKY